jgi:VanZ family protein
MLDQNEPQTTTFSGARALNAKIKTQSEHVIPPSHPPIRQQLLRKNASVLHYMYTAYLFTISSHFFTLIVIFLSGYWRQ